MRYLIKHMAASDEGMAAFMTTYSAVIAETPSHAADIFCEKHPGRIILNLNLIEEESKAFLIYGMGAWTDEEIEAYHRNISETGARSRIEHDAAKDRLQLCLNRILSVPLPAGEGEAMPIIHEFQSQSPRNFLLWLSGLPPSF